MPYGFKNTEYLEYWIVFDPLYTANNERQLVTIYSILGCQKLDGGMMVDI